MKKILLGSGAVIAAAAVLFAAMQIVPYGKDHSNPPIVSEPAWDSPETRAIAKRACFDCHSNETVWPWYSNVAPVSWLVQRDVEEGRERLNFSDWQKYAGSENADEAAEAVQEGEMPPMIYLVQHPEANLSAEDKNLLVSGLNASLH